MFGFLVLEDILDLIVKTEKLEVKDQSDIGDQQIETEWKESSYFSCLKNLTAMSVKIRQFQVSIQVLIVNRDKLNVEDENGFGDHQEEREWKESWFFSLLERLRSTSVNIR